MIGQRGNTNTESKHSEQTLKVLHVISINGIGGAERHITYLLPALCQRGLQVSCLILFRPAFAANAKQIGGQLEAQAIQVTYQSYSSVFSRSTILYLTNFLRRQVPDLIHTHLKHTELWMAFLKWRKQIDIPVVTTIHGYRDAYHNQYGLAWQSKAKQSWYYWLTRFVGWQLDGFLSISKGITDFFISSGLVSPVKIHTVHHGTEINSFNPNGGVTSPSPNLVLVGRLVRFKGHIYAIGAVQLLRKKYPTIKLHFYGQGIEEKTLREQVKAAGLDDHVIFHGFISDIASALQNHSIALLPSIGEPFGLVYFDAFKAGLPVVAFDVPAVNEIITHGENGLLAKPFDMNDLGANIELLLQNPSLYRSISEKAFKHMSNEFSLERMASAYSNYYRQIIKDKHDNIL